MIAGRQDRRISGLVVKSGYIASPVVQHYTTIPPDTTRHGIANRMRNIMSWLVFITHLLFSPLSMLLLSPGAP